ncbi:hypothetical protein [Rheinheimera sp. 1928-s]|uniref:hypothetical protein n=1 Tax=Rheinheimera sp. 1928-s TaxID=3033803 RepID=UPI002635DB50|nr:hypothetical protein [Rheinheimera sp. 1928-s]MDF3123443.1 hypothetical protein [Rheinheimera sp. 1928-s]
MQKVSLYHALLHDAVRLKTLWQQEQLDEFVALMRQYLRWPELNFEQLQRFLAEQNQQAFCPELASFSLCWQPYAYQAQRKIVRWAPAFLKPSLPFFEDDLALSRQSLLAQLIQPFSELEQLLPQRLTVPAVQPALLIFHWSRCGSTLVSGSFALHQKVKVLSESMLASDLLNDPYWAGQQPELLDLVVRLQGRLRHNEQRLVIKCNAWDLQHWPVWLSLYPKAGVLCVIRQPEAVLASHHHLAGRHMVRLQPELWKDTNQCATLLDYRIEVVRQMAVLMNAMRQYCHCTVLSYEQLKDFTPPQLASLAGLTLTDAEQQLWREFRLFDAKQQGVPFQPTKKSAEELFSPAELKQIRSDLQPLYQLLLAKGEG